MNEHIQEWYDQNEDKVRKLMHDIWLHPELGLKEEYAANATAKFASEQGFTTVEMHNAEKFDDENALKNSVVAKWGSGKPAIAFVGELDALPGLGQELVPYKSPKEGPGHACGHNTMAGCAAAAASSVKYAMEKEGIQGTVVLVEAPAEEIGRGKAALARAGVFKDLDLILMWHPGSGDLNVAPSPMMVIYNALFEFFGTSYHAAGKHGERGRSALDAAQLMNIGCEFLREHLPRFNTSHHYCFRDGGLAPNIVPAHAAVEYYFRGFDESDINAEAEHFARDLFDRAVKCAEGAALMTETEMKCTLISHMPQFYHTLPLNKMVYEAALKVPELEYSEEEYDLAAELYKNTHGGKEIENRKDLLSTGVVPYSDGVINTTMGATDASDMTYFAPTIHCQGLGRIPEAGGHNWIVSYLSGMAIGEKGGVQASKVLSQTAYDAFCDHSLIEECWDYYKKLNVPDYDTLKV